MEKRQYLLKCLTPFNEYYGFMVNKYIVLMVHNYYLPNLHLVEVSAFMRVPLKEPSVTLFYARYPSLNVENIRS